MPSTSTRLTDAQKATLEASVRARLKSMIDANPESEFVSEKSIPSVQVDGQIIKINIALPYPARSRHAALSAQVKNAVDELQSGLDVEVTLSHKIVARAAQKNVKLLPEVKNIIAVASGKGGVGKSTTAVNLALALLAEGASVGLLDADIYGPSLPTMLGVHARPTSEDGETIEPIMAHGLQVMSIGLMVDDAEPMIWRGPMATQALDQLLRQTRWRALDYLVVDLPPGTGDIQLTLAQRVPVTGVLIVTTPQDIALIDARKGYTMFEKVGVSVIGIVENMSIHVCSQCGHAEPIFGEGGAAKMSEDYHIPVLGALPLSRAIREEADSGKPTVIASPESAAAQMYLAIARQAAMALAKKPVDFTSKFPNVVVKS
ncbi:MAG: iron-sulfur cluster carrier protein ApbC [Burkholderiales bacterium]|nr:iron-sulfur cluster carrier protein ApbC [Burkholderiales bacterium]